MWNRLNRSKEECTRLRDKVEETAAKQFEALSGRNLKEELTPEERKHVDTCQDCQEAVQELFAARELFQGVASFSQEERPWFAARVLAAIAARERELAERVTAWTEFPRFASRLSWVAVIVLLASTTWFYETVVRTPSHPVNGSQESIFEAPQQSTPDDILISQAGDKP